MQSPIRVFSKEEHDSFYHFPVKKDVNGVYRNKSAGLFYFCMLLPAILLLTVFFAVPVLQSLQLSFMDVYGISPSNHWVGWSNYLEALSDKSFTKTISTTFIYAGIVVLGSNVLALILALILDGSIHGRNLLRACFFIPNIMSLLVVGYVWRFVYTNALPSFLTALGLKSVAILGNPSTAIYALSITGIWNCTGYYMVIYIAALQSVSEDLLEAARIDGADGAQILFRIKLPLISPTIFTCLILSVAANMKVYEIPYTMVGGTGGPAGAAMTMVLKIYNTAFNASRTGYATAQSTILFVLIASISLALNMMMRKREEKIQ